MCAPRIISGLFYSLLSPPTEQPRYSVVDRPFSAGVTLYYCFTTPFTTALRLVFTTASGLLLRRMAQERAFRSKDPVAKNTLRGTSRSL